MKRRQTSYRAAASAVAESEDRTCRHQGPTRVWASVVEPPLSVSGFERVSGAKLYREGAESAAGRRMAVRGRRLCTETGRRRPGGHCAVWPGQARGDGGTSTAGQRRGLVS